MRFLIPQIFIKIVFGKDLRLKIEKLSWDSSFFSKNCFRVDLDDEVSANYVSDLQNNGDGVYFIFSSICQPCLSSFFIEEKCTLTTDSLGEKTSEPDKELGFDFGEIEVGEVNQYKSVFYDLSIQSSEYSRFRKDIRFSATKVDELYSLWVERAIKDKSLNYRFYSHRKNGQPISLCLVKENGDKANIDIVAVDSLRRGVGLGADLIRGSLRRLHALGVTLVTVTTQSENLSAIRLYENTGFRLTDKKYIYHIHLGVERAC